MNKNKTIFLVHNSLFQGVIDYTYFGVLDMLQCFKIKYVFEKL